MTVREAWYHARRFLAADPSASGVALAAHVSPLLFERIAWHGAGAHVGDSVVDPPSPP